MKPLNIRALEAADIGRLTDFELENRAWFEQNISERGPQFYTTSGLQQHMQECLDNVAAGHMYAAVLLDENGALTGRANLRHIDQVQRSAELGYRVAMHACGQGLASAAVRYLLDMAVQQWGLRQVVAYVNANNLASAKVLAKCGFTVCESIAELSIVNGVMLSGHRYVCELPGQGEMPASV